MTPNKPTKPFRRGQPVASCDCRRCIPGRADSINRKTTATTDSLPGLDYMDIRCFQIYVIRGFKQLSELLPKGRLTEFYDDTLMLLALLQSKTKPDSNEWNGE